MDKAGDNYMNVSISLTERFRLKLIKCKKVSNFA